MSSSIYSDLTGQAKSCPYAYSIFFGQAQSCPYKQFNPTSQLLNSSTPKLPQPTPGISPY